MFRSHSKSGWNRLEIFAVSKGFDQLMKLIGRVLMEAALATLALEEDMHLRLVAKEMEKEHLDRWTNERDRAIQLLHEGIGYLTNLKEYWAGKTRHFQSIHNIIKATRASKLIDLTERRWLMLPQVWSILSDFMANSILESSRSSYLMHRIADTHVKVSTRYIMNNAAGM